MSSKKKIYLLLLIVLLVWGIIGFKIYQQIKPRVPKATLQLSDYKYRPIQNSYKLIYSLHSDYRDPFLRTLPRKMLKPPKKTNSIQLKKTPAKKRLFPRLTYKGMVNPKAVSHKSVFIIEINGKSELFKIGQNISGVRLLAGGRDEVRLQFQDSILKATLKP